LQFIVEAQINDLKVKGLSHLSEDERLKFSQLKAQLLVFEDQKLDKQHDVIVTEKSETAENTITLATEQAETTNISKTDQKIAELKAILVDNPDLHNH
jgi:hypothetical protein